MAKNILLLTNIILFLLIPVTSFASPVVAEKIAQAYGIDNFSKVRKISYTFNVKAGGNEIHRRWVWFPKTDEVEFVDLQLSYPRDFIPDELKGTDHNFINDNYWLLFPFHLVWDKDVEFEEIKEKQTSPIKKEMLRKLLVKYINNAGYTPNDIYELYYDDNYIIREWVYRKGGSEISRRAAAWENYKEYNGILISEKRTGEKGFILWFTDIEIN